MIFVWGLLEDPTTRSVCDELARLGAEVAFVSHADVGRTSVRLASGSSESCRLRCRLTCRDVSYELGEMSAAYLRPYDYRDYIGWVKPGDGERTVSGAELVHHLVSAWAESAAITVINRPSAEASNHSKLYQAELIRASGFCVPESLVTNQPDLARAFQSRHGSLIYKSMSSVRSVVQELDVRALDAIEHMGPVLFQQRVMGTNIRVHVVGSEALACAIESGGVDYRYAESRVLPVALPVDIAERCVALAGRLGLLVAGLDLILSRDGEWHCLEVNPNPAFSAFETGTEQGVARRVAALLAAG